MTLALTLICADRSFDVHVPSGLPIAVLEPEIATLTGIPAAQLSTATGQALDRELSFSDNGVVSGAVVQVAVAELGTRVYDDISDLARSVARSEQQDARQPVAVSLASVLTGITLGVFAIPSLVALLAAIGLLMALTGSRAVLGRSGVGPDMDATTEAARARVRQVVVRMRGVDHAATCLLVAAGAAAATDRGYAALGAAWVCIGVATARTARQSGVAGKGAAIARSAEMLLVVLAPAALLIYAGLLPGLVPA